MISSFPIGSVPIGSNQLAGFEIVSLGVADATSAGLLLNIGIQMGQGSATAQGLNASNYISLQLGQSGANAQALDAIGKFLAQLGQASGTAQALDVSGLKIGLGQASGTAQGELGQFKVFLDLGQGGATAQGNVLIPKQIAGLIFAHAIASAEPLGNLQIRLKIGRADSEAVSLDLAPLTKLELGQAFSTATGLDFSGVGLGLFRVDTTAQGKDIVPKTNLSLGIIDATADALDFNSIIKPLLGSADAIADALDITEQELPLVIGEAIASALNGDITYLVDGVPEIVVTRSDTSATLKVLNQNQNNLRIFRADDHRGSFSVIASNHDDSTDYVDSGLDQTKNYKYVAAFVVVGTKGGSEFIVTGQRCLPVYTIGNQIL